MFYGSWPCNWTKSKTYNHGFLLNSRLVTWWACIMSYWAGNGSLDCWFVMITCTTLAGLGMSVVELEDDKFGLEGWTKDERFESSMLRNSHGLLSMMNETLWKNNWLEDDDDRVNIRQRCWVAFNPLLLYILGDVLFSHELYQWLRSHRQYKWFRLSLN